MYEEMCCQKYCNTDSEFEVGQNIDTVEYCGTTSLAFCYLAPIISVFWLSVSVCDKEALS